MVHHTSGSRRHGPGSRPGLTGRRRHGFAPRTTAAFAVAATALLAAACSSGTTSGSTSSGGTSSGSTSVRFIWSPSAFGDWFAAKQQDYWTKEGISLDPIDVLNGGAAVMSSLASSSADMALVGDGPVVTALAEQLKLDIVGIAYTQANAGGLFAKPGSGLTSNMHSLEGKTIATTKGSGSDIALHKALADAGVPASKVHLEYIAPADAVPVLQRGQVDGEWYWDTPGQQLEAAGAQQVTSEASLGINANLEVIVVRPDFLQQHPDVVAHALAALMMGGQYANAHPAQIASYMAAQAGLTPAEGTKLLTLDQAPSPSGMLASTGSFSLTDQSAGVPADLKVMAAGLQAEGLIKDIPADLGSVIDTAPLQAAVQDMKGAG
jgi:ABC-type nitrate/sulfonate/bicarbonate transport system substrate-binding protein